MQFPNIFGSPDTQHPAQAASPQPAPGGQGNIPPVQQVVAEPGNPTAPVLQPTPVEPVTPKDDSPLAEFKSLWDTAPTDPNAPAPAKPVELDAAAIQKVVANVNFSQQVTPETLAAISAGGEGAEAAFTQAMNAVAQQVMVQSTLVNSKLTDQAVQKALKTHTDSLPALLRSQAASDHLVTSNPLFSNPAIKPVIDATQAQLLQKYPDATQAELTKMTQEYIVAMGAAFNPQTPASDLPAGEEDWSKFV